MMDDKLMTTPMITNLKKLKSSRSSLVDPTCYQQLIGSLMYIMNIGLHIFYVVNVLFNFKWIQGMIIR